MSELALELIKENKRTKSPFLDLGRCGLVIELPEELFECVEWIRELNLGIEYYDEENKKWILTKNKKDRNILIGKELIKLVKFKGLQKLYLKYIRIDDYRFLGKLTQLQSLELSNNHIQDISFLEGLIKLQKLSLSKNQISDITSLERLTNLQSLDLGYNQISDITSLERLTNLQSLDLGYNQISDITSLERLTNLQSLDLGYNQISDITSLERLTNLQSLDFGYNQITDIRPLSILLKKDLEVDIKGQNVSKLIIKNGIESNPIENPPIGIVRQGRKAIINWIESIEKQGEEIVYEAKLMIIGDAGSGKTSLATKLKNLDARLPDKITETTVGIEISQLAFEAKVDKPQFMVNIWDLGGQKIYHPLHQLFFTQRSLYVLVSDGRNDTDENDLTDFWIPAQELLAKDSPMLILFNKHGNIQPNMAFRNFQLQYPNIKGDLAIVDLLTEKRKTADFIVEIEKYMRSLPQFVRGEKLPRLWAEIRRIIHQRKENYLSLQEFRSLCSKEGMKDYDKQDFLSDYLHDLGILLRFREDPLLNKIVFLNPQWALDCIYKVLDHTRQHNNGVFTKDELLSVWKKPELHDVQDELLALMLKFELCYKTSESLEQYLVPSLLSKDIPDGFQWDKNTSICLYYEYNFMPKGIISRLIVRLNRFINKRQLLWREGVVFESKETSAWLARPNKNRIEIYAKGDKPSYLINLITDEIDDINSRYYFSERSRPRKYVPCICQSCNISSEVHYYKYETLTKMDKGNQLTIRCENDPFLEVNIKALLGNVESKKSSNSNTMKKIFVSYSKFDEAYKEEFKQHMKTLKRNGVAEIFDDRQIELGDEWNEVLKQKIDECDYFVCLISRNFLNVDYINDVEIPRAIKQGKRVIPIIIKPCDWTGSTLGEFNAHNKGGIIGLTEDYKNGQIVPREYTEIERDAMWVGVVNAIRGLIERDK